MTLNPPFVGGTSYTNTPEPQPINRTLDQGLPLTSPLIPIDNPVGGLNTRNPDNHTAYTQQWSLNVQRQLGGDFLLEVSYVGNHSVHLQDQWDLNQPFPGTGPVEQRRPFYATAPNLAGFTHIEQRGLANYDALQIQLTKRFSKGLSFLASYTWGKVIENASSNYGGPGHQDARNLNEDRGPAGIDLRQRFVSSWLYELPFGKGKQFLSNASGVVNQFVGGWQLGGVATDQTGLPFTVYGGAGRPNRICNGKLSNPTVNCWFDASCFVIPATVPDPVHGGVYIPFGNSGAYILSTPGVVDFDFSALKSFRITETKRVEFRSEWFNAFNHAQFLYPDGTINDGTTGQIFHAKPSRQIQMILKFLF